jgi:hypothetical protein
MEIKRDVFGINYFFQKCLRGGKKYDTLKHFGVKTPFNKKKKIEIKQFRSILKAYSEVYLGDLYYGDQPMYFPIGGKLMKTRSRRKNKLLQDSIYFIWYHRMKLSYALNMKLIKVRHSNIHLEWTDRIRATQDTSLLDEKHEATIKLITKLVRND